LNRCLFPIQVDTLGDMLAWVRFQRRVWSGIPDVARMPADWYRGLRCLLALVEVVQRAADGAEAGTVEHPGPTDMRGLPHPNYLVNLAWDHAERAREAAGSCTLPVPRKDHRMFDLPAALKELERLEAWCQRVGTADVPETAEVLDLNQIAAVAHKQPRSMENYKRRSKDPLPDPDFPRQGRGSRDYWRWSTVRPWLVRNCPFPIPESIPDIHRRD
jgi:hypothetical protein